MMSEELTTSSTKKQDSTQTGSTTPIDLNFSLHLHVHVTAAPALQAALDRIVEALKPVQKEPEVRSEIVFHGLNEDQTHELIRAGVIASAMAGLEPTKHDDTEFHGTIVPRPDWVRIPGYKDLRYYEDGDKLFIKYCSGSAVETTWQQLDKFSKLPMAEYKAAREELLEKLKLSGNAASTSAVNCFVTAIQRGKIVPPEGSKTLRAEKAPEMKSKKGMKVHWKDIPKHPHLRYREEAGKLILNYAGSIVETTWQQIENTARLDQKYWRHEIAKILGNRQASNRRAAVNLFLKLVEKGEVSRVTISKFQSEEDIGVKA